MSIKIIEEVDKLAETTRDMHGLLFQYLDMQTAKDEEMSKLAVQLLVTASAGADAATNLALYLRDLVAHLEQGK